MIKKWAWCCSPEIVLLSLILTFLVGCATQQDPESLRLSDIYRRKASAYLAKGQPRMALPALERARKLTPKRAEVLAELGRAYDLLGRRGQASLALEKAYRLHPDDERIIHDYAASLLKRDLLEQAEKMFQLALEKATSRDTLDVITSAYFNLSLLYKKKGFPLKRRDALKEVLALNPGFVAARLELADHYDEFNQHHEKKNVLKEALSWTPDHIQVLERLVKIYQAEGDQDKVRRLKERLTWLKPRSAEEKVKEKNESVKKRTLLGIIGDEQAGKP
ncbi:tetratricopeptide repeat protein [Magnetococcales bacterium HHB-1]